MPDLVFTRLHLPRPLGADSVAQLMTRLMSADAPRPLVFEVHASADGVTHLVGYPSAAAPRLKRLLRGHLPGLALEPATRPDVAAVSRVVAHPAILPLADTDPEQVTSAIYLALAARRGEEHVALQLVLGRTQAAHSVSAKSADPMQPLASLVFEGVRAVEPETRRRLQLRAGQPTTAVTLGSGSRLAPRSEPARSSGKCSVPSSYCRVPDFGSASTTTRRAAGARQPLAPRFGFHRTS